MPELGIIILNYNNWEDTVRCLETEPSERCKTWKDVAYNLTVDAVGVKGYFVNPLLTHTQKTFVRARIGLEPQGLQKCLQPLLCQLSAFSYGELVFHPFFS